VIYVYLLYGLAFIALGLILSLQARMPVLVLPHSLLWVLAAFGLLHGAAEWLTMATMIEVATHGGATLPWLEGATLCLAAFSFAVLGQFGVEWRIRNARWPKPARAVPGALFILWVVFATGTGALTTATAAGAEAVARYFLGLPFALVAASGFYSAGARWDGRVSARTRSYLIGAAVSLTAYSLFAGLVVPRAPFWPASTFNAEVFRRAIGVPVMVFRALCGLSLTIALSLALVVEAARTRAANQRLREEFISVVAHDLRSPIGAIRLHAEALEKLTREQPVGERVTRIVAKMNVTATRLGRMVGDLLDASLVEAKRLALRTERVDLDQLIRDVVDRASGLTGGRAVRIVASAAIRDVELDPQRFEQIMVNLLSNATKYASPDSEIVIELRSRPGEALVSVTNAGPGIAPAERSLVFDRFYRSEGEGERTQGLGLGLYIVKGLVEAHGGRVWVESEPGRNTTFRFTLPRTLR
jgi:signal transduction histidine kinase